MGWMPDSPTDLATWEAWQLGVLAGCIVYITSVGVVLYLLVAGGSFKRMKEQAEAYTKMGSRAFQAPLSSKPKLYQFLLDAAHKLPVRPAVEGGALQGVSVELEALSMEKEGTKGAAHPTVQKLFDSSDGSARFGHGSYDPVERIWRWLPEGPYASAEELQEALTSRYNAWPDRLDLAIHDRQSGYVVGMVSIMSNRPRDLAIEIGDLWITPAFRGTYVAPETCLLLLRHLFKLGYRRVEWRCDVENLVAKKAGERMGFHQEGVLRKDSIWREVNRDTAVMSMTNSDWRDGTEEALAARLRRRVKGVEGAAHVARRLLQQLDEMEEDEARKKEQ